ncbi:hypothetical protein E4U32_003436 [Claviceps aff. humidiphila group G2b]|nr:hypothetical protein E4U32_003436 [Claviceps aff. humidiphila group G2b]
MAVPSRVHREVVIKGTTLSDAATGRKPEEIVTAVNGAINAPAEVAARRLRSGDTVITFNFTMYGRRLRTASGSSPIRRPRHGDEPAP